MERSFSWKPCLLCFFSFFYAAESPGFAAELDATLLLINEARSAARAGKYDEAQQRLLESIKFAETAGQKLELAIALSNMGEVYRLQGNAEGAVDYYQQALQVYTKIGYPNGIDVTRRQIEEIQEVLYGAKRATPRQPRDLQEATQPEVRDRLITEAIERVRKRVEARRRKAGVGPSEQ